GIAGQEGDEQLAGLDAAPLCERISCDRASQIGSGPQNYRRTKTKAPLDCLFDPLGQRNQVALVSSENNVAALHVGLRISQPKRFVERPQRIHLDLIVSAEVD